MTTRTEKHNKALNLARESLARTAPTEGLENLLDSGRLLDVTAWSAWFMGLSEDRDRRARVAITARVFAALRIIPEQVKGIWLYENVRARGGQLLWLAGRALVRARKRQVSCAHFVVSMPMVDEELEDAMLLRAECVTTADGRPYVVIGLRDEFPLS